MGKISQGTFVTGLLLYFAIISSDCLSEQLRRYELIEAGSIARKRIKLGLEKSDASNYNRIDLLNFRAFNREFSVYLTPKRGLFSPDLRVYSVEHGQNGEVHKKSPIEIDENEFHTGHLHGADWSHVSAHIDENGALSAVIQTSYDTYIFEPAYRHLNTVEQNVTLAYKERDMIMQTNLGDGILCGDLPSIVNVTHFINRFKRQTSTQFNSQLSRCPLKIVADYKFHDKIGNGNIAATSRYLINTIDRINSIYMKTVWKDNPADLGISGLGFTIKEVHILTAPTPTRYGKSHYNMKTQTNWNVEQLLMKFSEAEGAGEHDFCLVHLFTYQAFEGGVLGLGYVGSNKVGGQGVGGMCSAPAQGRNGKDVYYNTALSSARSAYGGTVITREADIVTAHELGHNWGSAHDQPTPECSPSLANGGAFIMNTFSVSGFDPNNKKFSPCSSRAIKKALLGKKDQCFQPVVAKFCGNRRVELDEQCDAGLVDEMDKCCNQQCKLIKPAQCSPKNEMCCSENCVFSVSSRKCLDENVNECRASSFCNGLSGECPPADLLHDGTKCLEDGECRAGVCVSFCEKLSIGKKPCICPKVSESCFRCCRENLSDVCMPYLQRQSYSKIQLDAGTRCINGFCDAKGQCIESSQDIISHFWNIIKQLDGSSFWQFLRDNLVMTTVFVSLIFWIPLSCVVATIDKRRALEEAAQESWKASNSLVGEDSRVEKIPGTFIFHSAFHQ